MKIDHIKVAPALTALNGLEVRDALNAIRFYLAHRDPDMGELLDALLEFSRAYSVGEEDAVTQAELIMREATAFYELCADVSDAFRESDPWDYKCDMMREDA